MADQTQNEEGVDATVESIAATLLVPSKAAKPTKDADKKPVKAAKSDIDLTDPDNHQVTEEEDEDDDDFLNESPTGGDDGDDAEAAAEPDDEEVVEDEDEGKEDEDGEAEYLDIRDDDLITVMVDGEEQEVSIGDLKKAHSGEGAIEKRLQEATELRKTAHAERTSVLEKLADNERVILETISSLDESVFKAIVPPPNEADIEKDPAKYVRHKKAYEEDQKRISEAKRAVEDKKAALERQRLDRLTEYGKYSASVLAKEYPELADPKTRVQTFNDLAQTAKSYGYSDQEIANALDPRMFLLVRDAMLYRKAKTKGSTMDPKDLESQKVKRVRRLRSGNTQAASRVRQSDKARREALEKAQKSGKLDDIAATLVTRKR